MPSIEQHKATQKGLQVHDGFAPRHHLQLILRRMSRNFILDIQVTPLHEFPRQVVEHHIWTDAAAQHIEEFPADYLESLGRLLLHSVVHHFFEVPLPLRDWHDYVDGDVATVERQALQTHYCPADISFAVEEDSVDYLGRHFQQLARLLVLFLADDFEQDSFDFGGGRRRHPNAQTATPQRSNDSAQRVANHHNTRSAHTLLHRPSQCSLRFLRQLVCLVEYYDFERSLVGHSVAPDFLDESLHDDFVSVGHV